MFQIQDMSENGKPDIVLKTVKRYNYKKNSYYNFDFKKSLKLGIFVLVMLNTILIIVYIIDFYSGYGPGSQNCPFLTLSVRHGPVFVFELMSPELKASRHRNYV